MKKFHTPDAPFTPEERDAMRRNANPSAPFTEAERANIRRNAEAGVFIAAAVLIPGYEATIAEKDAEIRRLSDELIAGR